jgi:hypothetical protein
VRGRIRKLAKNLRTFIIFKKSIRALGKLAKSLPRDSCHNSEERKNLAMPKKKQRQKQILKQEFLQEEENVNKTKKVKTTRSVRFLISCW